MTVKKDVRMVSSKKDKNKMVQKTTFKCEGSYVDLDGKNKRYHKRGFNSNAEAKEWERIFLFKNKNEVYSDMTFNELYLLFMDYKKVSMKEASYYEIEKLYQKHLKETFGNLKLISIDTRKIDRFKLDLANKKKDNGDLYSNRTLEKIQTRFKTILKYGYSKGFVKDYRVTLFTNIQRSNEQKKAMQFWQPSDFKKFISCVDEPVYLAFFNVLYWCGLRNGETLALTWDDIDFSKKSLTVNKSYTKHGRQITTPKTSNSYRTVIIPEKCFLSLEALKTMHEKFAGYDRKKLLFNFDKPLDDNSIRIKKDNWIKKANVPRIRIHDFRHSHVSLLISLGFNPFDISKRLGHTVEMVNNVYGHWFDDAQKKMVDKLNSL